MDADAATKLIETLEDFFTRHVALATRQAEALDRIADSLEGLQRAHQCEADTAAAASDLPPGGDDAMRALVVQGEARAARPERAPEARAAAAPAAPPASLVEAATSRAAASIVPTPAPPRAAVLPPADPRAAKAPRSPAKAPSQTTEPPRPASPAAPRGRASGRLVGGRWVPR